MRKVFNVFFKDKVFLIAFIIAILTMFLVPPSMAYFDYINYKVLVVMLTIMLAVSGIFDSHFFYFVATKLVMHLRNTRFIAFSIIMTTFFLSMILTNDAVLLTLIPFSIFIFKQIKMERLILYVIIMQTIAANLGSALTPMGDPQNIYLYAYYQIPFSQFIKMTIPITLIGGVLITVTTVLLIPNNEVTLNITTPKVNLRKLLVYGIILFNALFSILRIFSLIYTFSITLILGLIFARPMFKRVDWPLLFTFVAFFIITGNLSQIEVIGEKLSGYLNQGDKVYFTGMALSQVISNVPAAVLLSTFTETSFAKNLLQGVNVGSMGTLIASLASLISFKYVMRDYPKDAKRYVVIYLLLSLTYMASITFVLYLL